MEYWNINFIYNKNLYFYHILIDPLFLLIVPKTCKNLVTGGLGFLGSNLINKLLKSGEAVICIDNCSTGKLENISKRWNSNSFKFIKHDILDPIDLKVDKIWHLACPASPIHYQLNPINTAKILFIGTNNMLELAKKLNARFLFASSSEVYGNPTIHPQPESYMGNVNNLGKRSCYEEGKRIAETLCSDYMKIHNVEVRIARIFNTYGPGMSITDGRVVSNLIINALKNEPMTIYGDGKQTRSFCFVDDLIDALISIMQCDHSKPINLGNPYEISIIELAKLIKVKTLSNSEFIFRSLPEDDPIQRSPDIKQAKNLLGWKPSTSLSKGLEKTINYFKDQLKLK